MRYKVQIYTGPMLPSVDRKLRAELVTDELELARAFARLANIEDTVVYFEWGETTSYKRAYPHWQKLEVLPELDVI